MKTRPLFISLSLVFALSSAYSQGTLTFTYDQQSADETHYQEGSVYIQQFQPMGQSFTPSLSAVGFVRVFVYNASADTSAAALYVNLRSGSITGAVLAVSTPVLVPAGAVDYGGPVNFLFQDAVSVNPGQTYFFQPFVQNNTNFNVYLSGYHYAGGTAFLNGAASSLDLWFREGTYVVPEPSGMSMVFVGGAIWCYARRWCGPCRRASSWWNFTFCSGTSSRRSSFRSVSEGGPSNMRALRLSA